MGKPGHLYAGRFIYRLVGPNLVPVRVYLPSQTGSYVRRRWLGRRGEGD